jgi:hypothetical protein
MDFGVAKEVATRLGSSLPGVILGTPAYISPEQVTGESVDHRSDVFAVGSTMYHLLTGTTPFPGAQPGELVRQQLSGELVNPGTLAPGIPPWLSSAVVCALERRPGDRYQSAAAMAEALRSGLRLEAEEAEWAEPSAMPGDQPGASGRGLPAEPRPWFGTSEDIPIQAERWGVQLRWVLATVAVSLVLTWIWLVPMQLVLRNDMLVPVSVRLPRGAERMVEPGEEFRLGVGHQRSLVVQWKVAPAWMSGTGTVGEKLGGVLRVETVDVGELISKRILRQLDIWKLAEAALAPRVINQSSRPITVRMLPFHPGETPARVAPGATLFMGYYRRAENLAVEVRSPDGDSLVFKPAPSLVSDETGEFTVRVTDSILAQDR